MHYRMRWTNKALYFCLAKGLTIGVYIHETSIVICWLYPYINNKDLLSSITIVEGSQSFNKLSEVVDTIF